MSSQSASTRYWPGALLGIGLAITLAGCGGEKSSEAGGGHQMPPPEVSVAQVVKREVQQWDEFTGRFEAVDSVQLTPRVSGYVEKVHFDQGAVVEEGTLLYTIDQRQFRNQVDRSRADLASARAQASKAESDARRAETLVQAKAISREEFDARTSGVAQAKAAVQAAQAALDQAELELGWTEVRAPISGRVGMAEITAGNMVMAGNSMLTKLVSTDPIYVTFEGDEQTYLRYGDLARRGERDSSRDARNPVRVGLANEEGYPHEGEMVFVDNALNPATGTIRARAKLANPDGQFTPGLFARIQLLGSGKFEALLINDRAVLTDQDRKYVYVIGPDNVALRKDVQLGLQIDGLRVVSTGLDGSERVVINGVRKIFFPGMPVAPIEVPMDQPDFQPPAAAGAADAPAGH